MMMRKCLVCGERLPNNTSQLCSWCMGDELRELLRALIDQVDSRLLEAERIDLGDDSAFSLVTDFGLLGIRHPLLSSFSKIISRLVVDAGKGIRRFTAPRLYYGQRNISPFLLLLNEFGLITYDKNNERIEIPESSPLLKVRYELEVNPRRNPAAAFILGYVTLKAILKTLDITRERELEYGEGVTGLYSITKNPLSGGVRITIPKSYMATITFVLGSWAHGFKEFSELDLHKFMSERGVTGKEFKLILGILTCAFATSHGLYERISVEHFGRIPVHRFRVSEEYIRLHERLRERVRVR